MNVIDNVYQFAKNNPDLNLRQDIQGALERLVQIANRHDFAEFVSNPSETDVFGQNALLYAFNFGSADDISVFLNNYMDKVNTNKQDGKFESGTFDLSSAGTTDDGTINSNRRFWWFQADKNGNLTIHKGWNRVELPLATMKQFGTFDLAKLDRIRFSCSNSVFAEGTIFKITDVKLVKDDAEIVLLTAQEVGKNIGEIISEDINYSETQAFIKNDAYRWDCYTGCSLKPAGTNANSPK